MVPETRTESGRCGSTGTVGVPLTHGRKWESSVGRGCSRDGIFFLVSGEVDLSVSLVCPT